MTISAVSSIAPLPVVSPVDAKAMSSSASSAATASAGSGKASRLPIYATPVYKFDPVANIPVELIRDPSTGTVLNQIPSEQVVQKYRLHQLPVPGTAQAKGAASGVAGASGGSSAAAGNSAATGGAVRSVSLTV